MTAICGLDAQICKFFYHIIVKVWQRPGIFIPFQPFWLHFSLIFGFWAKMLTICFGFSPTRDEVAWRSQTSRENSKFFREICGEIILETNKNVSFWIFAKFEDKIIKFGSELGFLRAKMLIVMFWQNPRTEILNFSHKWAFKKVNFEFLAKSEDKHIEFWSNLDFQFWQFSSFGPENSKNLPKSKFTAFTVLTI